MFPIFRETVPWETFTDVYYGADGKPCGYFRTFRVDKVFQVNRQIRVESPIFP